MNLDTKILNKILANGIQWFDQVGLFQASCQILSFTNQILSVLILPLFPPWKSISHQWMTMIMWLEVEFILPVQLIFQPYLWEEIA